MSALDCSVFTKKIEQQRSANLYRQRQCIESQSARTIKVNGLTYLNFSSNDYLGLNHHPKIKAALAQGAELYGTCASASSLVTGFNYAHRALEETICEWLNQPKCLLFGSGFSANYGVLNTLGTAEVGFCLDKLSHASLIDGALASDAEFNRYKHNDKQHLSKQLANLISSTKFVVTEGVFSMDGDSADIPAILKIAQAHSAGVYVDDAHAIGILGDKGQGSSFLSDNIDIVMGTFGKAIATNGAFIATSETIHDYMVNFCRHYIYSTAISPAIAWATKASIELIIEEHWRREKIRILSELLASSLDKNIQLISSDSSIHAIVIGQESKTLSVAKTLREKYGIWLTAIRPPTVPSNTSRLRVTVTASHNESDINKLVTCLHEVLN